MITIQDYICLSESLHYNIEYFINLANENINPAWHIIHISKNPCKHYWINAVEYNDFGDIDVIRHCCKCNREEIKCVFSGFQE